MIFEQNSKIQSINNQITQTKLKSSLQGGQISTRQTNRAPSFHISRLSTLTLTWARAAERNTPIRDELSLARGTSSHVAALSEGGVYIGEVTDSAWFIPLHLRR